MPAHVGKRILYFADPMCSWCWGFSPVLAAIHQACGEQVPIRLCVGGLRAGETRVMDARAKAYVRHHWQEVGAQTGQPFDFAFFDRDDFIYDTEPACRAAVAMRSLAPETSLDYFAAVQHAFYAGNRDVTREDVLADIAAAFTPRDDFIAVYQAPEIAKSTQADFTLAHGLGIAGFPTVVLQNGQRLDALTTGWQPFEALEAGLRAWLAG